MRKPLAIDLYAGLGGWSSALLAEGFDCIGFDIERHRYGEHRYPAQLVIQDVLTLHGSQFRDADLIVASPPCQEYSYMAMPWKRAKAKAAAIRADTSGQKMADLNRLFDACFRIQREANEAAGRHIPLVIENVRGAQPWVGRARWNFGSYYLWGDVPALMPITAHLKQPGINWNRYGQTNGAEKSTPDWTRQATKVPGFRFDGGGGSFQTASVKTVGHPNQRDGFDHTRRLTNPGEHGLKRPGINLSEVGFNVSMAREVASDLVGAQYERTAEDKRQHIGVARKAASAMIAKIPEPLARHIARVYRPDQSTKS